MIRQVLHTGMAFAILQLVMLASADKYPPNDDRAAELKSIPSLIFRQNAMTTGRRTSSVPQLTCVGGSACGTSSEPQVVHCTNIGIDYATGDPQWKCNAELENGLRLGTTDVVCEGFRDRDDPWILKGSCGLEYTLHGAPVRSQQSSSYYGDSHRGYKSYTPTYSYGSSRGSWVNWIVGGFILWMALRMCYGNADRAARQFDTGYAAGNDGGGNGGRFFGGGGGGGGFPRRGPYFGGGGADCAPNQANAGGAGFWQGLGAGAGLGYLFGRNNGGYGGYYQNPYYARPYGGGLFGGYQPNAGGGLFAGAAPAAPAGPATQTATGYGTTRRRG